MFNGESYFRANDDNVTGQELYRCDGTGPGVVQVLDINPGSAHSLPQQFEPVPGGLVFSAETATEGREIWITDGTSAGTTILVDLMPGAESSAPWLMRRAGPWVWFWALDAVGDKQIWRTDGTAAGTVLVKTFAGTAGAYVYEPFEPLGDGGHVVFRYDDGVNGKELWTSNGTEAGTQLYAASTPGIQGSYGNEYARLGDQLIFTTDDGAAGHELHVAPIDLAEAWVAAPYGFGCGLHLATLNFLAGASADAAGDAQFPFTVPSNPSLVGYPVYFQGAALYVGGPYLGLFELTEGLELVVGP